MSSGTVKGAILLFHFHCACVFYVSPSRDIVSLVSVIGDK